MSDHPHVLSTGAVSTRPPLPITPLPTPGPPLSSPASPLSPRPLPGGRREAQARSALRTTLPRAGARAPFREGAGAHAERPLRQARLHHPAGGCGGSFPGLPRGAPEPRPPCGGVGGGSATPSAAGPRAGRLPSPGRRVPGCGVAAASGAGGQAAARGSSLPLRAKMAGDEAGVTLGQPHLSRQDLATLVRAVHGASRGTGGGWRRAGVPRSGGCGRRSRGWGGLAGRCGVGGRRWEAEGIPVSLQAPPRPLGSVRCEGPRKAAVLVGAELQHAGAGGRGRGRWR